MSIIAAPTYLEIQEEMPTPRAPRLKTKRKMAFPTIFTAFIIIETNMVTLLFPSLLQSALADEIRA